MTMLDRRSVVLSAAAAGAAFGLGGTLEILPSALAQGAPSPLNPKGLKFQKFKVGDIEVTSVFDGAIMREHNPSFIRNASIDDLKASLKASGLPDDKVPTAYTVTIVKVANRTVMFDAGNGPTAPTGAGQLLENMKAAGIDPSSLAAIVVTHFHPDHIFGLMSKENGQVFANVEIVVPEVELKYWSDASLVEKLPEARRPMAKRIQATLPTWKNIRPLAADKDAVPGVRSVATFGHTPGHTSWLVSAGSGQLLVLGDVTSSAAINLRNPGWHTMFDHDPQMAEAVRRRTFDRAVADKLVCAGYHWGMPGAGTIVKDGAGYALVPVA